LTALATVGRFRERYPEQFCKKQHSIVEGALVEAAERLMTKMALRATTTTALCPVVDTAVSAPPGDLLPPCRLRQKSQLGSRGRIFRSSIGSSLYLRSGGRMVARSELQCLLVGTANVVNYS
jgi:hypothetical protein